MDSCGSLLAFKFKFSERKDGGPMFYYGFLWIIIHFQIQVFRKKSCQPLWFFITQDDVEIVSQDKWKFITIDNPIEIPNFNCIVQFKRDTVPKGGVAIYQNNNVTNIVLYYDTEY